MTPDAVKSQIIDILARLIPAYDKEYWLSSPELFGAVPEFDSMTIVSLIDELEEQFDIEFHDEDITAENFAAINTICDLILNQS